MHFCLRSLISGTRWVMVTFREDSPSLDQNRQNDARQSSEKLNDYAESLSIERRFMLSRTTWLTWRTEWSVWDGLARGRILFCSLGTVMPRIK